jgi:hypothetical protein
VEEHHEDRDDEGNVTRSWTTRRWEKDVREYVDVVQFTLVTASAGPSWAEGQLLALPDGSPATWSLPGSASEWTQNYDTPYFTVQQTGGWFSKDPPRIITKPGLDPALCLLIGHLATTEFSVGGIKDALRPDFPYEPTGVTFWSMLNPAPPPPPVIVVPQPVMMQYVNVEQAVPMGQVVEGLSYDQPQQGQVVQQGYAPNYAEPVAAETVAIAEPMPDLQMGQPMGEPSDTADEVTVQLTKLKNMLEQGLIDQSDYDKKKEELLAKM